MFHPKRITHAALSVNDIEASLQFYTEVLGLRVLVGSLSDGYVELGGTTENGHIILISAPEAGNTGLHHAGFEVWNDAELEESRHKLEGSGVMLNRKLDGDGSREVAIRDPDGFLLKFRAAGAPRLNALVSGPVMQTGA